MGHMWLKPEVGESSFGIGGIGGVTKVDVCSFVFVVATGVDDTVGSR